MKADAPWPVPPEWRWCRFEEVARVASNLVKPEDFLDWPHIAPNHIESQTGRLLPFRTVRQDGVTSAKHRFSSGHVLYAKIRPYLAKVVVADFDGLCSADMYPIESDLEPRYLKWWMLTREFTRRAAGEQARTVLPKINVRGLSALPVPVPPLGEQRRIVGILEDHFSHLDSACRGLNIAEARLRGLRGEVISRELLPSAADNSSRTRSLDPAGVDDGDLPTLPEGWCWQRLGVLAEVVGGVTKDAKRQADPSFVEVPYLRVANVQRGSLDLSSITTIRVPTGKANQLRLKPGDVLLNEGGDRDKLGRGWVWEGQVRNCIHQNHVFRARVLDGRIEPKLLSWAANSIGGRWCERNGKQSVNLASISLSKIRLMPVPVAPAGLQQQIVERIDWGLTGCGRLEAVITASRSKAASLRRALLEAAFSGRLTSMSKEAHPERPTTVSDG